MKLLKLLTAGRLATSKWALLGGAVLWLSVALSTPAQATNYVIDPGGVFSGSFELDFTDLSTPFTTWAITVAAPPFIPLNTLTPLSLPIEFQSGVSGQYALLQQYGAGGSYPLFYMYVYDPSFVLGSRVDLFYYDQVQIGTSSLIVQASQAGTYSQVPEPTALLLLAIGLLAIGGSRWLPGRREQQLG